MGRPPAPGSVHGWKTCRRGHGGATPSTAGLTLPGNLPIPVTTLIGREHELDVVGDRLRRASLVTLTGAGGVGKTRLALEAARRQSSRGRDGVWLIDLAAVSPGADVAGEAARALEISGAAGRAALHAMSRALADRHALLILDNCEHVIDACAEMVTELIGTIPNLAILATSREPLGVAGEVVVLIEPLAGADARRLFVERAVQRRPTFVPTVADDDAIADLCDKLDRLPLAIELAAARVNAMSPAEICASLDERRLDLGGGRRSAVPHHRNVRATVEWSYRLLDAAERRAFRTLGAFVGGFDAIAAEAVAPDATVERLVRLVDKSLVTVVETPSSPTRYGLLETVRQYALELLIEAGEEDDARGRHLRHFSTLGEPTVGWPSPGGEHLVALLEDDYGNVRAALDWAAAHEPCRGLRLLAATGDLFSMVGHADGWRLAHVLLGRCDVRDRGRLIVMVTAGVLGFMQNELEAANGVLADAAELAADIGEPALRGWAGFFQGLTAIVSGRIDVGRPGLEASRRILHDAGDLVGEARANAVLGLASIIEGDLDHARELVDAALVMFTAEGDQWGQGQAHTYLGIISESLGDETGATRHNRTAIECFRPFRDSALLPTALASQASVLRTRNPTRALKVVAAARAIKTRDGGDFPPFFRARADDAQAVAESALGQEAEAIAREGTRLDLDQAMAVAFGGAASSRGPVNGLSGREQEVAQLVADGLANKTIAAQLHLSVRTVESHVRHALSKLGLSNRTQLATWARDRLPPRLDHLAGGVEPAEHPPDGLPLPEAQRQVLRRGHEVARAALQRALLVEGPGPGHAEHRVDRGSGRAGGVDRREGDVGPRREGELVARHHRVPGRAQRLHHIRPRGSHACFRAGELDLHGGVLDHGRSPCHVARLPLGQGGEVVKRPASDAQRHAGEQGHQQRRERQPVERTVEARRLEERHHRPLDRDAYPLCGHIMAAGAP